MQDRKKCKNSIGINEDSDSSNENEEQETHISYNFRRWVNQLWNVSNNVTDRLKDLLGNHSSPNTTSNHSVEVNCEDESNSTNWTMSSGFILSSNPINDGTEYETKRYRQNSKYHHRNTPGENNYSRYDQKFIHTRENHRIHNAETRPNFIVGNRARANVTTYSPVLILPRLHEGVNRQSVDTRFNQSQRNHMSPCCNMHSNESKDERWYEDNYCFGKQQWDCNKSRLSEQHKISEKFNSSSTNHSRVKKKSRRNSRVNQKIEPPESRFKNFHSKNHRDSCYESISSIHRTQSSREKMISDSWITRNYRDNNTRYNSNFESSTTHTAGKKVIWDLQLSDNTSDSTNPSMLALSAKSSVTLNIEKRRTVVNRNLNSTLKIHGNIDAPMKDELKQLADIRFVPSSHDTSAIEHSLISHEIKNSNKQKTDFTNDEAIKCSSMTKNSMDSILQSLRQRMDTLTGYHSPNIECNKKENSSLTKECTVASCLAGTYLPECLESQDKTSGNTVTKCENTRPSFSDRIQDIWRDGDARVWGDFPRHQTFSLDYNLTAEKDLPSEFSILRLNQEPAAVIHEYFDEYKNAVTLTRILEKLIETKENNETPKSQPTVSRNQSKTYLQVNVGVQKSTPMSTSSSQNTTSYSKHCLLSGKHRCGQRLGRKFKARVSKVSIERPRPLQVFSGQNIIPISSIQFTPIDQPIFKYRPESMDIKSSPEFYGYPNDKYGDPMIIDNPVFQEEVSNTESLFPNHGSPYSIKGSQFSVNDCMQKSLNEVNINRQNINEQDRRLSFVVEKIEHKQQREQHRIERNADAGVRKQHSLYHSTPVPQQESTVNKDRVDRLPQGINAKGCSWWKKKFQFNKRNNFKMKVTSLFKYVSQKNKDDEKNENHALEITTNENIISVPVPPIRVRRKCHRGGFKSNKSIQWESNENMSRFIEKIDSFQETESLQQSNKSTSVIRMVNKVTVASSTDTIIKESHDTNTELSLIENNGAFEDPEIIQVSKQTSPFLNELLASDQTFPKVNIIENGEEKSELLSASVEPCLNNLTIPVEENMESLTDICLQEKDDFCKLKKSKVSRNLTSKIPLATKSVYRGNAMSTVVSKRLSTVPKLKNLSKHSLQSNGKCLGEFEADREFVNRKTVKKTLFKHNRSSLLRANNSILRKCTMGEFCLSRNFVRERNNVEKISTKNLPLEDAEVNDFHHSTSLISEQETKKYKQDILDIDKIKETTIVNWEIQNLGTDDSIIGGLTNLEENKDSNNKFAKDDKLPIRLEISENLSSKSDQEFEDIESNKTFVPTENVSVKERPEILFNCNVKTDEMKTLWYKETMLPLQNKEIHTFDNLRRPHLQSKLVSKSKFSPQLQRGIYKKTVSRKKCKQKLSNISLEKNENTEVIFKLLLELVDLAINKSVNINQEMNSSMFISKQNIAEHISPNSKKFSEISIDSLKFIQIQTTSETLRSIEKNVYSDLVSNVEENSSFLSSSTNDKKESGNLCIEKDLNIWSKKAQAHLNRTLMQSTITFDLVEMLDKPEILGPKMFNVQLESNVELEGLKFKNDSLQTKNQVENLNLLDTINSSRMMDKKFSRSSDSESNRNVKIDNKLLKEKVKCSIKNGVPLKKIIITDPSVIKDNFANNNNSKTDKIRCDKNLDDRRSVVWNKLRKNFYSFNNSQEISSLDFKNKEKCDFNIEEDKSMSKISSINKKPRKRRGSLIPRYKKITLNSQGKSL